MKKVNRKPRGESIIESIVAISIIIVALAGIMALFSTNLKLNQNNKNRVIAINLAREGIEAVRFVRDSNWLIYSNNRRLCWNNDTENPCIDNGNGMANNPLLGDYNAVMDPTTFRWSLIEDNSGSIDADNELKLDNGFYLHNSSTGSITPFQRQIQISYIDEDGNIINPTNSDEDNRMKILSIVQWSDNQKIELETVLTDFLERNWHNE